ncbi:MAG: hypothetical protein C0407_16895, partial [Desulfobacca sp.]|nr:hypothetical protein [Desulfobacca sp.]
MRKFWIAGLILLVLSGLIIGIVIAFHSLEEKSHRPHWFKERHHQDHSRSTSLIAMILLYILFITAFPLANPLWAEERDIILEESGIHYPGGFDPNTVGEIQGKAFHFSRPERGPVRFQLLTIQGTYTILTSPPWYCNDLPVKIPE